MRLCPHRGAPLPSFVAFAPISWSCRHGRRAQPAISEQDIREPLSRYRHLGHPVWCEWLLLAALRGPKPHGLRMAVAIQLPQTQLRSVNVPNGA